MDPPPATAQQPQQQQQQQRDTFTDTRNRGNLSYFLFISMMFFFMSSNTPDTGAEQRYRNALSRLKMEREEFTEWLYPHTKKNDTRDGHNNATMSSSAVLLATSDMTASPVETPSASATPGEGQGDNAGDDDGENQKPKKRDFVLQDLTPPPLLVEKVDRLIAPAFDNALYFHNISGFFKGSWLAHPNINITEDHANLTEVEKRQGSFPWTGRTRRAKQEDGKVVRLNVREAIPHVPGTKYEKEEKDAKVVLIRGTIDMQLHDMLDTTESEDGEYKSNEIHMEGVHYLDNGTFFLHAAPPWMDLDMRQLPGLLLSNSSRNETAQLVLKELDARIARIESTIASQQFIDSSSNGDGDTSLNCTFSMYGQLRALPRDTPASRAKEYEDELHNPTGRTVLPLPAPALDAILFSKECNLVLEFDNMQGLEVDRFWNQTIAYAFVLAVVTALQTWVLVKQMEYTSTPTAISKVSHLTIALQVLMDVYFCVTHLTLGIITQNQASVALLVPGFFGILSGLLFGLRYAAIIRVSTYRPPSPPTPTPAAAAAPAAPAPTSTQAENARSEQPRRSTEIPNTHTPLLGRPTPAPAPATVNASDDIEAQQRKNAMYMIAGLVTLVLALGFIGWFPILMAIAYGFWFPQIYHNAERGSGRHALLKSYILITAISRLFIPLYIWAYPQNLLFNETSPYVYLLVLYQFFQVSVLFLQDYLGPRFFLPNGWWFPKLTTWDYHPILPPGDIESSANSKGGNAATEVDCVICFEKIELANSTGHGGRMSLDMRTAEKGSGESSATTNVGDVIQGVRRGANRMSYMVPPCHHIAHTTCLESWAAIKMECPLCRRPLPPF